MVALSRDIVATPPSPTRSDLQRIAAGDQQCCQILIDSWKTPITVIASRYAARLSDLDDLLQIGRLAVYQSALNFDPSFGAAFGNYTKRAIKNSVMKESARLARQRKLQTTLEGGAEERDDAQEEMAHDPSKVNHVKGWVQELPEPHATIFRLLYVEGLKQRPVADVMGVSQPRVAQLHRSFLELAREAFAG